MPFRQRARITIENQRQEPITGFFYQITYARTGVPAKAACFHAQWRRSTTAREHPEHVILDGVQGQGHYVGTFLAWTQLSNGWWGEGEFKFYLDGDTDHPTICGTGTEDYFGGAWCFGGGEDPAAAEPYSTPFLGYPLRHLKAGRGATARPLPLARAGPHPLPARSQGHDPGPGMVARWDVPAVDRRHRLSGLLVPGRAARALSRAVRPPRAMVALDYVILRARGIGEGHPRHVTLKQKPEKDLTNAASYAIVCLFWGRSVAVNMSACQAEDRGFESRRSRCDILTFPHRGLNE